MAVTGKSLAALKRAKKDVEEEIRRKQGKAANKKATKKALNKTVTSSKSKGPEGNRQFTKKGKPTGSGKTGKAWKPGSKGGDLVKSSSRSVSKVKDGVADKVDDFINKASKSGKDSIKAASRNLGELDEVGKLKETAKRAAKPVKKAASALKKGVGTVANRLSKEAAKVSARKAANVSLQGAGALARVGSKALGPLSVAYEALGDLAGDELTELEKHKQADPEGMKEAKRLREARDEEIVRTQMLEGTSDFPVEHLEGSDFREDAASISAPIKEDVSKVSAPLKKEDALTNIRKNTEVNKGKDKLTGQDEAGPSSQFKDALSFFLPNIIGLVGGAAFGGVDAAVAGEQKAGQLAGGLRAFGLKQQELDIKKAAKSKTSAEAADKLKISKLSLIDRMKKTKLIGDKEATRIAERAQDQTTNLKKRFYTKNKEDIEIIRDLNEAEDLIGANQLSADQIGRFNARVIFKERRPTDEDVVGAKYSKGFWEDVAAKPEEFFSGKADTPEKVAVRKMYKIIVDRKRKKLRDSIKSHISPASLRSTGRTSEELFDELERTAEVFSGSRQSKAAYRDAVKNATSIEEVQNIRRKLKKRSK